MSSTTLKKPEHNTLDFDPFAAGAIEASVSSTEAQREVWLADQLDPQASLAYNESLTLRLRGPLDTAALAAAVDALVRRHPSLRSTFSADGTEMLIGEPAPLHLVERDLRHLDAQAQHRMLAADEAAAVREAFSLATGPLFRAALYQLSPTESQLLMTAHHAVCDGWSWGVIADDLGQLYAEQIGAGPSLDPAPSYADYVTWEQEESGSPAMQEHVDYWLSKFAGSSLPVLELPLDRARPAVRTFASERIDHALDRQLVDALRKTGAAQGASLYAVLFSGFAAMLHRLTAQDDLVIGIAAAGQMASNMPALVGHCVNLLPLRVAVDAALPFDALTRQSATLLLDAFEHQNLTYGTLLRKLPVARDPSRLPLVSVMFNVDRDAAPNQGSFPDIDAVLGSVPRACENFELFVNIVPVASGMQVEVQYNTDLFDSVTISRWLKVYEQLLRSAAASPAQSVGQLTLMPPEEKTALRALQPAPTPRVRAPLMHAAFCAQAAASPSNAAVRFAGSGLSYGELDARSNRLARALRERGIGRGQLVGLCLPRNNDMVVALLAVLKSGAAYVPLDPDFPQARLDYYAQDAALALLLTRSDVAAAPRQWRDDAATRIFEMDTETGWLQASGDALDADARDPHAEDPAYVIYTSGSTGQPKGVAVPHGAVANFLQSMQRQPGVSATDKLVAVTTLSFDIAVLELVLPLTVGAEVIIAPREATLNGGDLATLLSLTGATLMQGTPGLWRLLLGQRLERPAEFQGAGGRRKPAARPGARPARRRRRGLEHVRPDRDHDLVHALARRPGLDRPRQHLDRPAHRQHHRLDPGRAPAADAGRRAGRDLHRWRRRDAGLPRPPRTHGRPLRHDRCRRGAVAPLSHGRSRPLAQQRPARTHGPARLPGQGARLPHRAGRDRSTLQRAARGRAQRGHHARRRARRRAPGRLPHDAAGGQARPGSRQASVVHHPTAVHVAATCRAAGGHPPATQRQGRSQGASQAAGVGRRCGRPRCRSHRARAHRARDDGKGAAPPEPRGPRRLLRTGRPFAAGGAAGHAAEPEVRRPRADAHAVRSAHRRGARPGDRRHRARRCAASPAHRAHGEPPACAADADATAHSLHRRAPSGPGRVQPACDTPFHGPMDTDKFEQAFREIVRRQSTLRTTMGKDPETGEPCQVIHPSVAFAFPLIDLSGLPASEREIALATALRQAIDQPIDIHQAPLFRAALYRMSPTDHAFVFVAHHLIWDGWSYDLFQGELAALYGALVRGETPALPELAVSTGDYAQWYHDWLAGPEAAEQLKYWKARFATRQCHAHRAPTCRANQA